MPSSRNEYTPEIVSLPGETIQEILDDRQMTQAELADRMGRPKKTINEIVKGKASITPETALQLERALGVSATFWNRLEQNYQEYLARRQEEDRLVEHIDWAGGFPFAELVKRGYLRKTRDKVDRVRQLLDFFGVATPEQWRLVYQQPQASFRHARTFKSKPEHLAAWLRIGELEARGIDCEPYEKSRFEASLREARSLTRKDPGSAAKELIGVCARSGVAIAFVPQLPKSRVSGATRWLSPSKALIQLSLRYKTDDQLWFSFFHEAGHILLHGKRETFLDEARRSDGSDEEKEANEFAAEFLISSEALERLDPETTGRLTKARVRTFAKELGIAPGIVVGRLQFMKWLRYDYFNDLKISLRWES